MIPSFWAAFDDPLIQVVIIRAYESIPTRESFFDNGGKDSFIRFFPVKRFNLGRINKSEAKLMVSQLQYYIEKIGANRVMEEHIDFGVISPYRLQVQYIRQLIRGKEFFQPFRRQITIHTVDGFQGQERDVIFISLVRANDEGNIGFLNDLRRMNVAITRARMKLIIYGDAPTLTRHPFYKALYRYIQNNGKVVLLKPDFQVQE